MVLDGLRVPLVQAPLAGGASTPELAVAVCQAGALGFLAGGYRTAAALRSDIRAVRSQTSRPFAVNLFVPGPPSEPSTYAAYAGNVAADARARGLPVSEPRWTDDEFEGKLEVALQERPAAVSFTFGCPDAVVADRLREVSVETWVTVTEPAEARLAAEAGADALVVQGVEAGGHRASFADEDGTGEIGLLALLRLVAAVTDLPLVAAGGIGDGHALAAVLAAGAAAGQVGTGFLGSREAGTAPPHREALRAGGPTRLTRAFSGRRARGIVNDFMTRHEPAAPSAYPEVHYLTSALRAAARERGDASLLNLWAGQAHALAEHGAPAGQIVERYERELREAARRLSRWQE